MEHLSWFDCCCIIMVNVTQFYEMLWWLISFLFVFWMHWQFVGIVMLLDWLQQTQDLCQSMRSTVRQKNLKLWTRWGTRWMSLPSNQQNPQRGESDHHPHIVLLSAVYCLFYMRLYLSILFHIILSNHNHFLYIMNHFHITLNCVCIFLTGLQWQRFNSVQASQLDDQSIQYHLNHIPSTSHTDADMRKQHASV